MHGTFFLFSYISAQFIKQILSRDCFLGKLNVVGHNGLC